MTCCFEEKLGFLRKIPKIIKSILLVYTFVIKTARITHSCNIIFNFNFQWNNYMFLQFKRDKKMVRDVENISVFVFS